MQPYAYPKLRLSYLFATSLFHAKHIGLKRIQTGIIEEDFCFGLRENNRDEIYSPTWNYKAKNAQQNSKTT